MPCHAVNPIMRRLTQRGGFTLVELLVVVGIIAILIAISFPLTRTAFAHANCAGCASHMRTLGGAFVLYANDNNGQLPGRIAGGSQDKWPNLLLPYVGNNIKAYVDPGDPTVNAIPSTDLISNSSNNSSFFFNGFNDIGAYTNPNIAVGLANLSNSSTVILLGQKVKGAGDFYMDFVEDNEDQVLNKTAYFGGSNYAFADGSVQYLKPADYSDTMWLVNKNYTVPGK